MNVYEITDNILCKVESMIRINDLYNNLKLLNIERSGLFNIYFQSNIIEYCSKYYLAKQEDIDILLEVAKNIIEMKLVAFGWGGDYIDYYINNIACVEG